MPEEKFVKIDGINTRYWEVGDKGSGIVLVHGLGGFIENWKHNLGPLAQHHRVYALDLPGFGQTDKTPLIKEISDLTRFIDKFLQALSIERAGFIGNSLGGGLALQYALFYPQKVDKLVLVDNAGMGRGVIFDFRVCSLPFLGNLLVKPDRKKTRRLWYKIVHNPDLVTDDLVDLSYRYAAAPGAGDALLNTVRRGINILGQKAGLTREFLKKLDTVKAPTLIFWGEQDRIIPPKHADIAVKKIPGARLELFDNCGHMPMFEYPDKFNKIVLEFLK